MPELKLILIRKKPLKHQERLNLILFILVATYYVFTNEAHGIENIQLHLRNIVLDWILAIILPIIFLYIIVLLIIYLRRKYEDIGEIILRQDTIAVTSHMQTTEYKISDISSVKLNKKGEQGYVIKLIYDYNSIKYLARSASDNVSAQIEEIKDTWQKAHPRVLTFKIYDLL